MTSTADDNHIVFGLWLWAAPCLLLVLVMTERIPGQAENGVAFGHPSRWPTGAIAKGTPTKHVSSNDTQGVERTTF